MDYCKLNSATREEHFTLPFIDQMLHKLAGMDLFVFSRGTLAIIRQLAIAQKDQEKTTFTRLYETFVFRCVSLGLCKTPATFK